MIKGRKAVKRSTGEKLGALQLLLTLKRCPKTYNFKLNKIPSIFFFIIKTSLRGDWGKANRANNTLSFMSLQFSYVIALSIIF